MNEKHIKAYCQKPDCFLKKIGLRKYNLYSQSELEELAQSIRGDFENIESRFNKWGVVFEFHNDILKKDVVDGALIRTRDYAVALYLKWYELNKVNAEVIFDREYKHPEEEYKEIELLMKQYGFHIIKPKR